MTKEKTFVKDKNMRKSLFFHGECLLFAKGKLVIIYYFKFLNIYVSYFTQKIFILYYKFFIVSNL